MWAWVVIAMLAAVALPVSASEVAAHGAGEERLLALINQSRSQAGRAPLVASSDLATNARNHAVAMATSDHRHHQTDFSTICCWRSLGENVYEARGVDTRSSSALRQAVDRAHRRLMESSSHRGNILKPDHHDVGIGVVVNHANDTLWVAQVFRERTDGPLRPAPRPAPSPDPSPSPPPEPVDEPEPEPDEPEPAEQTEPAPEPGLAAHEPVPHDGMVDHPLVSPTSPPATTATSQELSGTVAASGTAAGVLAGRWLLAAATVVAAATAALIRRRV